MFDGIREQLSPDKLKNSLANALVTLVSLISGHKVLQTGDGNAEIIDKKTSLIRIVMATIAKKVENINEKLSTTYDNKAVKYGTDKDGNRCTDPKILAKEFGLKSKFFGNGYYYTRWSGPNEYDFVYKWDKDNNEFVFQGTSYTGNSRRMATR